MPAPSISPATLAASLLGLAERKYQANPKAGNPEIDRAIDFTGKALEMVPHGSPLYERGLELLETVATGEMRRGNLTQAANAAYRLGASSVGISFEYLPSPPIAVVAPASHAKAIRGLTAIADTYEGLRDFAATEAVLGRLVRIAVPSQEPGLCNQASHLALRLASKVLVPKTGPDLETAERFTSLAGRLAPPESPMALFAPKAQLWVEANLHPSHDPVTYARRQNCKAYIGDEDILSRFERAAHRHSGLASRTSRTIQKWAKSALGRPR